MILMIVSYEVLASGVITILENIIGPELVKSLIERSLKLPIISVTNSIAVVAMVGL